MLVNSNTLLASMGGTLFAMIFCTMLRATGSVLGAHMKS